jgi:hypothetical protein
MLPDQNTKAAIVLLPQSIGTTEVTGTVDTIGFDHATVIHVLDTADPTSVITSASVNESEAATGAWTAVAAAEGGTGYTNPVPNTSTGDVIIGSIALAPRKRYLQVTFASTDARLASVVVLLSQGDEVPDTDTLRNATAYTA